LNDTAGRQRQVAPGAPRDALRTYRRLLGYMRPHRGMFALGMLGGVLFSATMVSFSGFAKVFGDGTFTHPDPRLIVLIPLALVALVLLRGLADFVATYCMGYVGRRVISRLRQQVFERCLQLPVTFFDRNAAALLLSRLTYNSEQVGQAATDSVATMLRESLTILGAIGVLLYLNLKLSLIALIMGPLVAWLVSVINRRFRRYGHRIQDSLGDVTRVAKEAFESPRLIKVYNAQRHLGAQFAAVNERNQRSNMRLILTRGLANPVVQLVTAVGAACVIGIAIADTVRGRMTGGDLLAFLTALALIAQPLRSLVGVAGPMQQGIAAAQSLFELLDEPAETQGAGLRVARVRGEVEFNSVSFGYDSAKAPALSGINLRVAAGENVAIVGRSGSGKSTLVNLLPRFYDAQSGIVRVDDVDVREYDLHCLREQIAVVTQDVVLFNDSIRNNIAFGREAPAEVIERAAEAAHVMEFVSQLPDGLDTLVGDRGVLLSGGQRQRIAIARALLKDAPILILDEATSALDTEAERHIQAALAQLVRNRTTFVIAHRLSTVESVDRIIVLDCGALAESGTHEELLARGGLYSRLHRLQFSD